MNDKQDTPTNALSPITPDSIMTTSLVEQAMLHYANKISYTGEQCDNEAFIRIFLAMGRDAGMIASDQINPLMTIWSGYSKNPSAFKAKIHDLLNPKQGATSKLASKYESI